MSDIIKLAEKLMEQEHNLSMVQKALSGTFYCERFRCRLLPESCVKRQKVWNTEIYQGCMGCKQGPEIARKAGVEIECGSSKRSSPWKIPLQHRRMRKNVYLYQKTHQNLESYGVRKSTAF